MLGRLLILLLIVFVSTNAIGDETARVTMSGIGPNDQRPRHDYSIGVRDCFNIVAYSHLANSPLVQNLAILHLKHFAT